MSALADVLLVQSGTGFSPADIVGCVLLVFALGVVALSVSRTRMRLRRQWERENGKSFPVQRGWRSWFGKNQGV